MNEEYISIKEFAELAGVSVQAVYKRLNNQLNPYIKLVENRKMLKKSALYEVYGIKVEQPIQPNHSTNSTEYSTKVESVETVKLLQKTVEILENELKIKNQQIETLQKENSELSRQLLELSGKVGDSLQGIVQTQLADKMIEGKKILTHSDQEKPEQAEEKTKGLFTRLFRR